MLTNYVPRDGIEQNAVEQKPAAWCAVSPGKTGVIVLLKERNSQSSVIKESNGILHEIVRTNIPFVGGGMT